MNELIKITDMTGKYDISARTLRYYEDMGLLASTRSDDYAYRLYDDAAVQRLEQILILRKLNISIKDIQRIFNAPVSDIVLEVLSQKVSDIDDEVALLHELKDVVLEFIRQIQDADFSKDSDIKLLYEKARDIETQLVNYDGNPSNVNRLLEVTEQLGKKADIVRKYPRFSIGLGGYGTDEETRAAFTLYEEAFGATITWEANPPGPDTTQNLHIGIEINGFDFLLKTQGEQRPIGSVSFNMHFSNEESWRQAYDTLKREGSDYSTQSWEHAPISATVTDKFGVHWWLHT